MIKNWSRQLQLHQTVMIAIAVLVLLGLVASLMAIRQNQDIRQQARVDSSITPLPAQDLVSGTQGAPAGCYYQQVQCIQAPCPPVLVCPDEAKPVESTPPTNTDSDDWVACTMDAKICPDGTAVGRDPKLGCEFPACPSSTSPVNPAASCGNRICEPGEADQENCPSCPPGQKVCPMYACQLVPGSCPQDCQNDWATPRPTPKPTPQPAFSKADLNQDGRVDLLDFSIMSSEFFKVHDKMRADLNGDGRVDLLDFSILNQQFQLLPLANG